MRSQQVLPARPIRSNHLEDQARTRFGQALPGIAGELTLFIGGQLVRQATDDSRRMQPLGGGYNALEHVVRWHDQQRYVLSLLLGGRDHRSEQFLLVFLEYVGRFQYLVPAKGVLAMIDA